MTNLINCGTCGYPLAPEERTTLVEKDGVMVKPAFQPDWMNYQDGYADGMAQAMAEKPAREPLNRRQVQDLADDGAFLGNIFEITQAIEAAHGIKGEGK